jgi:quercetin dioxygenase-like cupin family protein
VIARTIKLLISYLLSCAVVLSLPLQTPVMVLKEPRHHVKFENKYVRVIDASVPKGDATLFHTHPLDNVPVAISGGKLKTELLGQEGTYSLVATGGVSFARAAYTHRITNIGDTDVRFIDAEVLASTGNSSDVPPLGKITGTSLVIDNERVRVYRVVLEPGEATEAHDHKLPRLSVVVGKGKAAIKSGNRKLRIEQLEPGDFRWLDRELNHSIKNVGATRIEIVDIEWK